VNIEEAIRDLGNELAELTGDNYARIKKLEDALADARRDHADLVGLVERIGRDLDGYITADYGTFVAASPASRYPYTIPGQREYDAAMHEAEGPPETRESTGTHGYGGPGL